MKYKHIRSAARGLVGSFTSLMNGIDGDYTMDVIARRASGSGEDVLTIDWLTGSIAPEAFCTGDLLHLIDEYVTRFPQLLSRQRLSIEAIRSAVTTIRFFLDEGTEEVSPRPGSRTVPYVCRTVVIDNRGVEHFDEVAASTICRLEP